MLSVLVWQEGGDKVALLMGIGVAGISGARILARQAKQGRQADPLDPAPIQFEIVPDRHFGPDASQQIALGGMTIAMPIFLQTAVLEYKTLMQAGPQHGAALDKQYVFAAVSDGRRSAGKIPGRQLSSGSVSDC